MIKSFRDEALERCWREGRCARVPAGLRRRVLMKLDSMDAAACLDDLRHPPGNRLHLLRGEYEGRWALAVSGPWRLVFRFHDGHVYDVLLTQYH